MVPLWLDEGLAEYFEVPASQRQRGSPHWGPVKRAVLFRRYATIESLEGIKSIQEMSGRDYRQAWSWVHFMLHGPVAARQELQDFMADIQAHAVPGQMSDRLARRIPDLDRQFRRHFRR